MTSCMNYRKIIADAVRYAYPVHRIDGYIDSLEDAKFSTILDASFGFRQFKKPEKYRDATKFTCHAGLLRFF